MPADTDLGDKHYLFSKMANLDTCCLQLPTALQPGKAPRCRRQATRHYSSLVWECLVKHLYFSLLGTRLFRGATAGLFLRNHAVSPARFHICALRYFTSRKASYAWPFWATAKCRAVEQSGRGGSPKISVCLGRRKGKTAAVARLAGPRGFAPLWRKAHGDG